MQQYGLPTDGSADDSHSDSDSLTAWQEGKAWTDPPKALSVPRMLNPQSETNGTVVIGESVAGQGYLLERAANLTAPFTLIQSNITGQADTTSYTDTTATNDGPFFYRVEVR